MSNATRKRDRSPNFPYLSLTASIDSAQKLYNSAKGNPVYISDAAADWGLSPTSSSLRRYTSALKSFGLLKEEGSGEERKVWLTEQAIRILSDARPGVRDELLSQAALYPPILHEYATKWSSGRPNDKHAISTLQFESNFTERAARTFLAVFDDAKQYILTDEKAREDETNVITDSEDCHTEAQDTVQDLLGNAPVSASPSQAPIVAESSRPGGSEWLKARVSLAETVTVIGEGEMTAKKLRRLIRLLETQAEMMEDDE